MNTYECVENCNTIFFLITKLYKLFCRKGDPTLIHGLNFGHCQMLIFVLLWLK